MASSNRHWPSMYRSSLACNIQQPQPDMNNGAVGKSSLTSSRCDVDGRNPEPRPRWNPRPEQIRILEAIFNSGIVNPPRDEIRRIRVQLSAYGPVGDTNVFYWFQNRKSRTKHKLRAAGQLQQPSGRAGLVRAGAQTSAQVPAPVTRLTPRRHMLPVSVLVAPTSSLSSSSDRSSGSSQSVKPTAVARATSSPPAAVINAGFMAPATPMDFLTPAPVESPAARQLYYHSQITAPTVPPTPDQLINSPDPLLLQWQQHQYMPATELGGLLGSQTSQYAHALATYSPVSPNVLLGLCNEALGQDCINMSSPNKGQQQWNTSPTEVSTKTDAVSAAIRNDEKARLGSLPYDFGVTATATTPVRAADAASTGTMLPSAAAPTNVAATAASSVLTVQMQELLDFGLIGQPSPPTATLVAVARDTATSTVLFSVPAMHLDVSQFGEAAVLMRQPTGELVLVDKSGVTIEPLQQDGLYSSTSSPLCKSPTPSKERRLGAAVARAGSTLRGHPLRLHTATRQLRAMSAAVASAGP